MLIPKADDTRDIFLSNVGHFHWEWVTHFYLDILDRLWALCLIWLSVDANIAQKVAQCIISLTNILISYGP